MSPAAARVVTLLAPHTPFAEAIVRRQAERAGFRVETLSYDELIHIAPNIIAAASVFVEPVILDDLKHGLHLR